MKKNKYDATEHEIQSAYFQWVRAQANNDPRFEMIFAIPNGAHLAKGGFSFRRLWKEGFSVGLPDVVVAFPASGWHGMFLEFKSYGGKIGHSQDEWAKRLTAAGYCHRYVDEVEEAIKMTKNYFFGGIINGTEKVQ